MQMYWVLRDPAQSGSPENGRPSFGWLGLTGGCLSNCYCEGSLVPLVPVGTVVMSKSMADPTEIAGDAVIGLLGHSISSESCLTQRGSSTEGWQGLHLSGIWCEVMQWNESKSSA